LGPLHCAPPFAGAGLVQVRVRVWVPPPQVVEQAPQLLQLLQPPLVGLAVQVWLPCCQVPLLQVKLAVPV
jgi:hypothetical protein